MIIIVFRSRLRPGLQDEYLVLVEEMRKLAVTMPGYVSHKGFWAEDGERVTIVEFESKETLEAWRTHPEHRKAQKAGRDKFYAEYHLAICEVQRESHFTRKEEAA